jgi:hypothetical protein
LTKVSDASTADGSTDWFKIKEIGPKFPGGTWDSKSFRSSFQHGDMC